MQAIRKIHDKGVWAKQKVAVEKDAGKVAECVEMKILADVGDGVGQGEDDEWALWRANAGRSLSTGGGGERLT